jgi:ADP-ribose pyrophosphatase YjhB (NUDIX family)
MIGCGGWSPIVHGASRRSELFCAWCGSPLVDREIEGRMRRACSRCSHVVYAHPTIGAVAAVVREGTVLLVRRRVDPFRGHWTLPAGYLEIEEEPWEAARRETREETGIEIEHVELLDVLVNHDDHRRRGVVVAYLARPVGGELRAGDDAEEARFFELARLPEELGFANNRRLLNELVRRGLGGRAR